MANDRVGFSDGSPSSRSPKPAGNIVAYKLLACDARVSYADRGGPGPGRAAVGIQRRGAKRKTHLYGGAARAQSFKFMIAISKKPL